MSMIAYFEELATKINTFETDAKKALEEGKNEVYIELMEQKAHALAVLPIEIRKHNLSDLKGKAQVLVMQKINQFASSAQHALHFKSPWYMSQLLYDTDHKEGNPNNFTVFLNQVKELNG